MGITTDHSTHLVLCHYERFLIFHPLGYPYDSSCSYYISTMNCFKILHTWLYHIIISVGDVLDILFSSSLRCLFLLHMQRRSWHLICTTLQHGICYSISDFDRITTEKKFTSATMALNSALTDRNEWCAYVETSHRCGIHMESCLYPDLEGRNG